MPEDTSPTVPSEMPSVPPKKVPHIAQKNRRILLGMGMVVLIVVIAAGWATVTKKVRQSTSLLSTVPSPSVSQTTAKDDFFWYGAPKPLSQLTAFDLPNDLDPHSVVKVDSSLWFAGNGSLIEYSITKKAIVSYTNPHIVNCDQDVALAGGFIYASCHIDNIDDAFGKAYKLKTALFTGHRGIIKVNPRTHHLEHIFSAKDGLENGFNHTLYVDGNTVWVTTFNGIGRISATSDKVEFYTTQLGFATTSNAKSYAINHLLIDAGHVWAWNTASSESQGGIAVFDKQTGTWKAYGPHELKDYDFTRIDLESTSTESASKLIPGGIQIGFRDGTLPDGTDRFVEKQFSYATGTWVKVNKELSATGEKYASTAGYISQTYPAQEKYQTIEEDDGLTQIQSGDTTYILNGRDSYKLSPMFGNKRYILTTSSVDVLNEGDDFPTLLVKLGSQLEDGNIYNLLSDFHGLIDFLITRDGHFAIVTDDGCSGGGEGCSDQQKVWFIDLKAGQLRKAFTAQDGIPPGDYFGHAELLEGGELLTVRSDKGQPILSINTRTNALTILKPTPTPFN